MQISQYTDAPTLLCERGQLRRQEAPTELMDGRRGYPVPPPTAEDLAWNNEGVLEEDCDAPTEELDLSVIRRVTAEDPWFHARVDAGWEPQVRVRSRFESAAKAALLLALAWLPAAAFLLAS